MKRRMSIGTFVVSLMRILSGKPQIPPSLQDNKLLQSILQRRSVRRFTEKPIPDNVFAAILEAGRVAPSTVNLQTWSFAVFDNDQWREKFEHFIPFRGTRAVIILADSYRLRQALDVFPDNPLVDHTVAVMNASLAAMNMTIAAEALGVSSVMLSETGRSGLLDIAFLKEKLSLPEGVIPLMTIVFGYARSAYPPMPPRFPMDQITFTDRYPVPDKSVLQNWVDQMEAGYKASWPGSSFSKQVDIYMGKLGGAEKDLEELLNVSANEGHPLE
jgi:FMN reductase (NADPH)